MRKASTSSLARPIKAAALSKRSVSMVATWSHWAEISSGLTWAKMVRKAAETDNLADALDYSAVARTIASVVRDGRFRLIETAAERVAERLLADHPVAWLRLEVRKPIASGGYTAAVTIERGT